jgi:cobalt-zinc-cadmium efflux system protein
VGTGHGHGHATFASSPASAGQRYRGRLWLAFCLLATFMVVEALGAWWTGSLALLSDASHLATDVLGIGMALAAIHAAGRAASGGVAGRAAGVNPHRTFGLYRLEVLAALGNAVLLFGVATFVLVEAVRRISDPPEVLAGPMLVVAGAGLLANVAAFAMLRAGARESLNVRGAYLEVLGDLLSSLGVLVAAVVVLVTGWWHADPLAAVAVALFILPRTWALGRSAVRVLVQAAPNHISVPAVRATLAAVPGVRDVHDLHVWTLTSGMDVASAHLTVTASDRVGDVLGAARDALQAEYGIDHATLQVEPVGAGPCPPTTW